MGVGQAKDYAGKLTIRFTYATNSQSIYGIDMHTGIGSELARYPRPEELWNCTFSAHKVFWHPDGTPMSAQQFMEALFGKLPEFFKDEEELRALWGAPDTRRKLLEGLAEKGFGKDHLAEMQRIIDAEKSDLFDVLAHVAYALAPLTREERAAQAMAFN